MSGVRIPLRMWVGSSRLVTRLALGALACAAVAGSTAAKDIVVTHWGIGMPGVPYAVAMEKGYFKEAGVSVTGIIGGPGGGVVLRNIMANEAPKGIPYGEVSSIAYLAAHRRGLPVIAVNTGCFPVDNAWVTLPSSAIKTLSDLVGKRIGYSNPKSVGQTLLLMVLKKGGIDPSRVNMVAAGGVGQNLALLENGGVDAANILDPLATLRAKKYRTVFSVNEVLPVVPLASFGVVTREYAKKHPEEIRALIEGRRRAVEFIKANPEEAGRILTKYYKKLPPKIAIAVVKKLAKAGYWGSGAFKRDTLDALTDGLKLTGELKEDVAWSKAVDASMLPDVLKKESDVK